MLRIEFFSKTHNHSASGTLALKSALICRPPAASAQCGSSLIKVVASLSFSAWSSLSSAGQSQSEIGIKRNGPSVGRRGGSKRSCRNNAPPAGRKRIGMGGLKGTDLRADVAEDILYCCAHREAAS